MTSAYPVTSCSSLERNDVVVRPDSSRLTSSSDRVTPSILVDDATDSMVATLRRADSRSGATFPSASQRPLNSSTPEIRSNISGVITRRSSGLGAVSAMGLVAIVGELNPQYSPANRTPIPA